MKTDDRPTDDLEPFEARLRAGLDHIASTTPVQAPGEFAPDVMPLATAEEHRRRIVPILAVAAVAAVVVTGLALITTRDPEPARSDQPAPLPTPEMESTGEADSASRAATGPDVELAPGGALVFDETPDALADPAVNAGDRVGRLAELGYDFGAFVRRWYTATTSQPELAASLVVDAMPAGQMSPDIPDATEPLTVQGVAGELYDDPVTVGRSVTFTLDDTTYRLTGGNITDDDLLLAAEHVRVADDGYGAVVGPAGLSNDLVERGAGTMIESSFISRESLGHPAPQTGWGGDGTFWVLALTEDPDLLPLHRLGYDTVTDTTVHGQPAFVTTLSNQPGYHGVTWSENGITYLVGTNGLDAETAVDYANRLRPATAAEWDQLVQETEARETSREQAAPPSTGPMTTAVDVANDDERDG